MVFGLLVIVEAPTVVRPPQYVRRTDASQILSYQP